MTEGIGAATFALAMPERAVYHLNDATLMIFHKKMRSWKSAGYKMRLDVLFSKRYSSTTVEERNVMHIDQREKPANEVCSRQCPMSAVKESASNTKWRRDTRTMIPRKRGGAATTCFICCERSASRDSISCIARRMVLETRNTLKDMVEVEMVKGTSSGNEGATTSLSDIEGEEEVVEAVLFGRFAGSRAAPTGMRGVWEVQGADAWEKGR